ncbi:MAG: MBL fold metallo-hydrolase [Candidatus Adiutrix sp.]|nr:MBL fold metallo-hydrolase [Candidatus Adiutrix sp.]
MFLRQTKFGLNPQGDHLARMAQSPNYRDGEFKNSIQRPPVINSDGRLKSFWNFLFSERERAAPVQDVPSQKPDLKGLDRNREVVVWLGHSSFFIQLGGRSILIDPVFSDYAAPVSFVNKAFPGANPFAAKDMPEIDYLLITHDHWDHLDYQTVSALKSKIKNIVVPLGLGSHFRHWGFPAEIIREGDWNEVLETEPVKISILPAEHYSGRWLDRNKTLWAAFALESADRKIFVSGDSGYGPHFEEIGRTFDGFDLAVLDSGQYDPKWPYTHMNPEEAALAANDLKAKALLPAHVGKFSIAYHSWDDPFIRLSKASDNNDYRLLTPVMGQIVDLDDHEQIFADWWQSVK